MTNASSENKPNKAAQKSSGKEFVVKQLDQNLAALTDSVAPTTGFDLAALRLPANYGATLGVTKLLNNVLVGKAKKSVFFRTHNDESMAVAVMILELKDTRETYVVMPNVAQELNDLVRPVQLFTVMDRQNNISLVPVPLPGEDGTRNPWHESLAQAVELAKKKWLRISANMAVGGYDVYVAEGELPEPEWPEHTIDEIVQVAFRGKIISSLKHPVVQTLLGRV